MLYRGTNKANNKKWIIADNEEEALEIAIKIGFVKNKKNCKLKTSDKDGNSYYESFKSRGNDMCAVDRLKGVGGVYYSGANDRGTWVVSRVVGN